MSYNIALNFEDGVIRFISCKAGETVLDAAYRQKVNLLMVDAVRRHFREQGIMPASFHYEKLRPRHPREWHRPGRHRGAGVIAALAVFNVGRRAPAVSVRPQQSEAPSIAANAS